MAKKISKAGSKTKQKQDGLMGWKMSSFLKDSAATSKQKKFDGFVYYVSTEKAFTKLQKELKDLVGPFQVKSMSKTKSIHRLMFDDGVCWVLHPQKETKSVARRNRGRLSSSAYSTARDLMGPIVSELGGYKVKTCKIEARDASQEEMLGLMVGAEIGAYSFKKALANKKSELKLMWDGFDSSLMEEAKAVGMGTNLARHLVNVPANHLYPESYAKLVQGLFDKKAGVKVTVWDEKKLEREGMNLIRAVGGAAKHQPRMVHIRYRPRGTSKQKPLALVGKGITFDSGGLDIKPPAAMRNMKKDMGGSAAIVGLFYSLAEQGLKKPLDIYLPMAENAIAGDAFRPGDIYTARNGKTVEIHNTDAEGRLVLADALAYASEQKGEHKPEAIINVATLTGAVKVGLGIGMGGFFSDDDGLAQKIEVASQSFGDLMWEMPLFDGYRPLLGTNVADMNHCASAGFGGAITAALFLHEFAGADKFAHFDLFSWTDRARGAVRESGGSGQGVQCLYKLLTQY